ncbi:hypothetical protein Tdes44962_MAKER03270 [Teratosphaeria destructans]|uniref:Uncharacterized protein n=1 Tax=Teratosphaeria destructans TaxID=418781 RepID=A0A9W7W1J0_9PEZI|nr:hypothetical protein Tdes44962_MAKER03270 [Teratosphaeria destructans]
MSAPSSDTQRRDTSLIAATAAAAVPAGTQNDQGDTPIANDSKNSRHDQLGHAVAAVDDGRKSTTRPPMSAMDEDVFYSAPAPSEDQGEARDEDGEQPEFSYQEPAADQILPPTDFRPFFTLVEDPESGEVHHPAVHYVFTDDDQDILTDAALAAIDGPESSHGETGADERFLFVNIGADGKTVLNATSLSPQWQNVKATMRQAPSWGQTDTEGEAGLMLRVSGQETQSTKGLRQAANLDELARTFGEKLDGLEEILCIEKDGQTDYTAQMGAPSNP